MNRFLKSIGVFLVILFSITAVSAETLTSKLKRGEKVKTWVWNCSAMGLCRR